MEVAKMKSISSFIRNSCCMAALFVAQSNLCSASGTTTLRNYVELKTMPLGAGSYITFNAYSMGNHTYPLQPSIRVNANAGEMFIDAAEPDSTITGFTYCLISRDATLYGRHIAAIELCRVIVRRTDDEWQFGRFTPAPIDLLPNPPYIAQYKYGPFQGAVKKIVDGKVTMAMKINILEQSSLGLLSAVDTLLMSN
jgi:hypothetical protein